MAKADQMRLAESMLFRELSDFLRNVPLFLENSKEMARLIGTRTDSGDVHAVLAYEKYMCQMTSATNMIRKINVQLSLNFLGKSFRLVNDQILKNFVQTPSVLPGGGDVGGIDDMVSFDNSATNSAHPENILENFLNCARELEIHDTQSSCLSTRSVLIRKMRIHDDDETQQQHQHQQQTIQCDDEGPKIQTNPIFTEEDLTNFNVDYEFRAAVTYIEDYKHLIFYAAQINDPLLLELHGLRDLECICTEPPKNIIFGVSIESENIMRVASLSGGRGLLIDFGEEIAIDGPDCKLYHIPEKYQQLPAKAIKCKLLCVRFSNGHEENNPKQLANCLQRNEFKEVSLKVVRKLGRFLHVHLHENMKKPKRPIQTNPFLKNFDEKLTTEPAVPASCFELQYKTATDAASYEMEEIDGPMQELDMEYGTGAQGNPSTALKFSGNEVVMITVMHLVSVTSFYANIEDGRHAPNGHPLFWHDEEISTCEKLLQHPQVDDIVLAQYEKDKYWYRARVLSVNKAKQMFQVFYVDYGNTEYVPLSSMAVCNLSEDAEYFRAYLCRLVDLEDNTKGDEQRYDRAIQALLVMLGNHSFSVKIIQQIGKELLIRIVDPDFASTSKILVELGYANYTKFNDDILIEFD